MPYIRDLYGKWHYRPTSSLEFSINAFLGTDGVGVDAGSESDDGFTTDVHFDYDYINTFLAGGIRWSPTDTLFIDMLAGYNRNLVDMEFEVINSGTREYSQEFIDEYGAALGLSIGDSYSVSGPDRLRNRSYRSAAGPVQADR